MVQPSEEVIFAQAMESLWLVLYPPTEAERAAFLKAGVTGDGKWQAAYPRQLYVDIMEVTAKGRYGHLDMQQSLRALGKLAFTRFDATLLGRAQLAVLKLLGPKRAMARLTRSFRNVNNFTTTSLEELSANHVVVRVANVIHAGFYQGIIESGLERSGAVTFSVKVLDVSPDRTASYDVTWQ